MDSPPLLCFTFRMSVLICSGERQCGVIFWGQVLVTKNGASLRPTHFWTVVDQRENLYIEICILTTTVERVYLSIYIEECLSPNKNHTLHPLFYSNVHHFHSTRRGARGINAHTPTIVHIMETTLSGSQSATVHCVQGKSLTAVVTHEYQTWRQEHP